MSFAARFARINMSKRISRWLHSRKYRKYRIFSYVLFIVLFGHLIPYTMVPPPDPAPNGIHMDAVKILDVLPTANQPSTYSNRILMFGNSALSAYYLPTEQSIASYLQAHFHNALVMNLGIPATNVNGELLKLMDTRLSKGDTVIFYDGANEANISAASRPVCTIPIGIVALICAHIPNTVNVDLARSLANDVKRALRLARAFSEAHGATFIHIFQPICLRQGNPFDEYLRQMVELLSSVDNTTINMAHFLDCYNDYFFDFNHTRPKANIMIADHIYEKITEVF